MIRIFKDKLPDSIYVDTLYVLKSTTSSAGTNEEAQFLSLIKILKSKQPLILSKAVLKKHFPDTF